MTLSVRPLQFSLSVCNGWGGSRRSEAYRHVDHKIRDWAPSVVFMEPCPPTALAIAFAGVVVYGGKSLEVVARSVQVAD